MDPCLEYRSSTKKYLLTSTLKWNTVHGLIPFPPPPTNMKWGKKKLLGQAPQLHKLPELMLWLQLWFNACIIFSIMMKCFLLVHTHTHSLPHLNQHQTYSGTQELRNILGVVQQRKWVLAGVEIDFFNSQKA